MSEAREDGKYPMVCGDCRLGDHGTCARESPSFYCPCAHPAEVLEADDTVPVERLAHWLHGEFGPGREPWAREQAHEQEHFRRTARAMRAQLPELFR